VGEIGADAPGAPEPCRSCGSSLLPGSIFCPECGAGRSREIGKGEGWSELRLRLESETRGEFQILEEIGSGAMGAVYRAREQSLERLVAVKVLFPHLLADETILRRFYNEAKIVAALRHPGIVNIITVRNVDDLHFFVMDHVNGASLRQVLRARGPLSIPMVKEIAYQAGSALAYAHRHGDGVIHRDVKPGNIMLDREGRALVMDFGLSKGVGANKGMTARGAAVGTPEYMSPEQSLGRELTPASDQYSLGVVVYTLLTGRPPFQGGAFAVLIAHTNDEPPSLRELRPDCPDDLARVVERMMAKEPTDRWPDIREGIRAFGGRPSEPGDAVRREVADLIP
jgi:serine/threonine-protein kinase